MDPSKPPSSLTAISDRDVSFFRLLHDNANPYFSIPYYELRRMARSGEQPNRDLRAALRALRPYYPSVTLR